MLNIEKSSLPRLMLSGDAFKDAATATGMMRDEFLICTGSLRANKTRSRAIDPSVQLPTDVHAMLARVLDDGILYTRTSCISCETENPILCIKTVTY